MSRAIAISTALFALCALGAGAALAEGPAGPGATPLEASCAGEAATQIGFDPRVTPRPVPTTGTAPSGAPPPIPRAGFGATQPPPPVPQQSMIVAQQQARWDADNARFLDAYRACLARSKADAPSGE